MATLSAPWWDCQGQQGVRGAEEATGTNRSLKVLCCIGTAVHWTSSSCFCAPGSPTDQLSIPLQTGATSFESWTGNW